MARDPKSDERLYRVLDKAQRKAVRVALELAEGTHPESGQSWKDSSNHVRASMILAQGVQAERRAVKQAATPASLGVIFYSPRMTSIEDWERKAAKVMEGQIVDSVPAEVVQRGIGPVGQGPGELREDLRQEEAETQHQAQEDKGR